ncbi:hypothetical protein EJ08DRAFT_592794 [Tothia fuscella]|uniref:Protein CMS1 n=1 Tax=Tothia fuscella TaxID=1048955 RepID=A0A9P4NMM6_9PEZI|nr:hypothetical protein EJ08DRAFT_592794 [Tothia fuscella]
MSELDSPGGAPLPPKSASPPTDKPTKRKRDDEERRPAKRVKKSKKQKRTKKPKDINEDDLNADLGINLAIGRMDGQLMVDYVAQRTKRFQSDLTTVELEELYLPTKAILDTSSWEEMRDLTQLPAFLRKFAEPGETLEVGPLSKGSPHTLVITAAGLRAADLTRALRTFESKDSKVAKLFAKHIKLKEAIETCSKTRMSIGVGTPHRIADLLDDGALSSKHLKRIVIDASYIDQKKRGILDMQDTEPPLIRLLTRPALTELYQAKENGVCLMFY